MDSIFVVDDIVERSSILQLFFQSFGCTYICIWSYLPHPSSKCLICKDGLLMEARNNDARGSSSSSESLARRLFSEYKQFAFQVDNNDCVPGFAFKNSNPFLELKELDLQGFASLEVQRQFYMEANIKRAVFMGCNSGEIELGFGGVTQMNLEIELRKFFPDNFSRQVQLKETDPHSLTMPFQDQQGSSSSSSLRSLSIGSPETTALYNTTQAFRPTTTIMPPSSTLASTNNPLYQASIMQPPYTTLIPNSHFPSEAENAVMTSAILAVLSASPSTLPLSSIPYFDPLAALEGRSSSSSKVNDSRSAFRRFISTNLPSSSITGQIQRNPNRVSAFKRIISYTFKSLHLKRLHAEMQAQSGGGAGKRPTSSQLHHMISERKRRVKMNESFDELRALLPPGTKKHKALVLNGAIDYLTSLQSQVAELSLRNLRLEAQLLPRAETRQDKGASSSSSSTESRLDNIQINNVSESTSNDDRLVDVRVTIRGEISLLSAVTRVVEFFRRINGLSLMSMEAETLILVEDSSSSTPSNHIFFRLRIEVRASNCYHIFYSLLLIKLNIFLVKIAA
ncbi:hypothetical protein QQ045_012819 [Rhodiola kirilowii]